MDLETAKRLFEQHGLTIISDERLPDGRGTQLRTAEGPMLAVYDSGKCVPGGKRQELLKPVIDADDGRAVVKLAKVPAPARKVFVVYGHEEQTLRDLEGMLRRWDLDPLILSQLPSGGRRSSKSWKASGPRLIMRLCS